MLDKILLHTIAEREKMLIFANATHLNTTANGVSKHTDDILFGRGGSRDCGVRLATDAGAEPLARLRRGSMPRGRHRVA